MDEGEKAEAPEGAGEAIESGEGPEARASSAGVNSSFRQARSPSMPFWIALLLVTFGVVVFMLSASALFVFGVGVAMAFFLVPVVNLLDRRGLPRWIAAILTVVTTLLLSILLLGAVAVILIEQGIAFLKGMPEYVAELDVWYQDLDLPEALRAGIDAILLSIEESLASLDQGEVVAGLIGSAASLLGGLFAWFLLPFFLFYLLKDQPRMSGTFYERVPAPWTEDVKHMLTITVGNFAQYFKAEFIVGSIMFGTVTIGMIVIGSVTDSPLLIQFALLLGLVAFVMELIPQIGPILSYIPALILAFPSGVDAIILVSVFYFVIFNIEGSILVPTFEGKMISFTGATVLVLIAIGFALGGIIGAILALPLASIIRDLFRLFFDKAVDESLIIEDPPAAVEI